MIGTWTLFIFFWVLAHDLMLNCDQIAVNSMLKHYLDLSGLSNEQWNTSNRKGVT